MATQRWYRRYAWVWFVLMAVVGLLGGVLVLVDPAAAIGMFARFGHELPASIASDPAAGAYVEFVAHWAATASIGFNLFGVVIAATAFRRGHRWAWFASWYWPMLFILHFTTYEGGFRYGQLAWAAGSIVALILTRPRRRAQASQGVPSADQGARESS